MKKMIIPMILLGALACAEEPEVAEVEPVETVATETETTIVDPVVGDNDYWVYTDWDVDANQELTAAEWDTAWGTNWAEWDVDGDGALGPDEAADTFWDFFDGNNDNIIDANEWNTGVDRWDFDGVDWGVYDTWDADANAELTETEWRTGWDTVWTDFGWDTSGDGAWGVDEASDNFWDFFDGNNDDIVDAGEWGYQD